MILVWPELDKQCTAVSGPGQTDFPAIIDLNLCSRGLTRVTMDLMADLKLWDQDEETVTVSLTSLCPGLMRGCRHGARGRGPKFVWDGQLPGRIIPNLTRGESYNDLATKWLIVQNSLLPMPMRWYFRLRPHAWPLRNQFSFQNLHSWDAATGDSGRLRRPGPGLRNAWPGRSAGSVSSHHQTEADLVIIRRHKQRHGQV